MTREENIIIYAAELATRLGESGSFMEAAKHIVSRGGRGLSEFCAAYVRSKEDGPFVPAVGMDMSSVLVEMKG